MAEVQAQGSDGNEGCTNNWGAAWKTVQLGEDRLQGEGGGPVRKIRRHGGVESKLLDPQATHTFLLSANSSTPYIPKAIFPPSTQKQKSIFPEELPLVPSTHLILFSS